MKLLSIDVESRIKPSSPTISPSEKLSSVIDPYTKEETITHRIRVSWNKTKHDINLTVSYADEDTYKRIKEAF